MNDHTEVTFKALPSEVTTAPPPGSPAVIGFSDEIPLIAPAVPIESAPIPEQPSKPTPEPAIVPTPIPVPVAPPTVPYSLIRQNYSSLADLGREMLEKLRKNKTTDHDDWDILLTQGEVTKYLTEIESRNVSLMESVLAIETAHQGNDLTQRQRLLHYYTLAFLIADDQNLYVDGKEIADIASLVAYMKRLLNSSYGDLERFCHQMVSYDGVLDLQLEAWLMALGKQNELNEWRRKT